jgi:predicted Zn-ribbon and HTH transcriptional regulator
MEDTFSRNYRALWKAARKINNVDSMELIFNELCRECGIEDEDHSVQAEAARLVAERMNARGKGPDAKKI